MPEIIAYGSGEMLTQVFTAISMLMNDQSAHFYKPLLRMGAVVGGLWALSKAFWESSISGLIFHWMIPMAVFVGICLIPSTSVTIIDVLAGGPLGTPHRVDHVPLGLARAAQSISYIGNLVTKAVETAFHAPDHSLYNQTGMIFGAENLLEMSRYAITDEHLADTMREFIHNCVTYDLTLELYSIDDLKKAPDIWKLIAQNTSNIRMFSLCTKKAAASAEGATTPQDKRTRCKLVSCKDGTVALGRLLEAYKGKLKTDHLLQHLPAFYQQLTGMAKASQDLISQQIMMHSLIDAVERKCEASGIGTNFAIRRAYLQQRNTYEVVGGLAAKSLVVLRNILEALIYAAFIFIMPFALMPMGFKVFLKWLWLLVWIQLWPPFYAILNSGIMTVTKHQAAQIPGIGDGLTLLTSTGLHNLALDMQTYAAYASLSIPFLSYALLQGGISTLAQVAGSITGVAQGAGNAAAQDLTTGNYNYGNVQLENLSYGNQTMLQQNLAPSLTTGHTKEDYGDYSVTNGENMVVNQRGSQLLSTINVSKGINQHLTDSATTSMERANREAESFSKTESESIQSMGAFTEHIASRKDYNHIYSQGNDHNLGEVAQKTMEQVANWSKTHGVTTQKGFEILAKASASVSGAGTEIGGGASATAAGTNEKTWQEAQSFVKSSDFSSNYQALKTSAENQNISINDEKGTNLAKTISKQHEESQQHQQQYEHHKQQAQHFARAAARVSTNAFEINTNETQNFVKFLAEQKTSTGKPRGNMGALYIINHSPKEFEEGLKQFAAIKSPKMVAQYGIPTNTEFETIEKTFKSPDTKQHQNLSQNTSASRQESTQQQGAWQKTEPHAEQKIVIPAALKNIDSEFTKMDKQLRDKDNHIQNVVKERQATVTEKLDQAKTTIPKHGENIKNKVKDEQNTSSIVRAVKAIPGVSTVIEAVSTGAAVKKSHNARQDQEFNKDLDDDPDRIKPTFKTDSKINIEKEKK